MSEWSPRLRHVLAVILMMVTGFIVLVLAVAADPANGLSTAPDSEMTDVGAMRALVGILVLCLLPYYRRMPLVLMGVGGFSAVVLGTDPFVLAVGLTVWIGRAWVRRDWWIAGLGGLAIAASAVRFLIVTQNIAGENDRQVATVSVLSLLMLCVALVVGISMGVRQKKRELFVANTAQVAQASSAQLSDELTRQREREELAREVHDTLASRLSAIALQTGSLEDAAREVGDPTLDQAMKTVRSNATNALTDLRSLLTSLREGGSPTTPPHSAPGGMGDLQDLFDDAAAAGLTVMPFVVVDGLGEAPDALRRAAVRITQEALTNALRHSTDKTVNVQITGAPGRGLRLVYANRYGYAPPEFHHGSQRGLLGIEERVRLLNGSMQHQRSDGRFTLTIDLPWEATTA